MCDSSYRDAKKLAFFVYPINSVKERDILTVKLALLGYHEGDLYFLFPSESIIKKTSVDYQQKSTPISQFKL